MKVNLENVKSLYMNDGVFISNNYYFFRNHKNNILSGIVDLSINTINTSNTTKKINYNKKYEVTARWNYEFYLSKTSVTINNLGDLMNFDCDCGYCRKNNPCGHIISICYFLNKYGIIPPDGEDKFFTNYTEELASIKNNVMLSKKSSLTNDNFRKFIKDDLISKMSKSDVEKLTIVPILEDYMDFYNDNNNDYLFKLRFKIGIDKHYFIKNLEDYLISPLKKNESIIFGKNLKVKMDINNFDDFSKKQIEFIRANPFYGCRDGIYICPENFDDFIDLYGDYDFGNYYNNSSYNLVESDMKIRLIAMPIKTNTESGVKFTDFSTIGFSIRKENPYKYFRFNEPIEYSGIRLTTKKIILCEVEAIRYSNLSNNDMNILRFLCEDPPIFKNSELGKTLEYLENMADDIEIDVDSLDRSISEMKENKVYKDEFSKNNGLIKMYFDLDDVGNLSVNISVHGNLPLDSAFALIDTLELLNIKENKDLIVAFILKMANMRTAAINTSHIKYKEDPIINIDKLDIDLYNNIDSHIIKNEDGSYSLKNLVYKKIAESDAFLDKGVELLEKYVDIYMSNEIRNLNTSRKVNLNINVRKSVGMLSLDINSDELSKDEIVDILNSYKQKKKFFRLKNGDRIKIDEEQLEMLDALVSDLNLDKKSIKKGKAVVPLYRWFQLNNLDGDNINLVEDDEVEKLFQKEPIEISPKFKNILRDYQVDGVNWLLKLRTLNFGGILGDDMGLGKTLQIIAYLESVKPKKPTLIVTPASLILNWSNEFKKFDSTLDVNLIMGRKEERYNLINSISDSSVLVTSYDYLKRDIDMYDGIEFDTVILDEAQYIKNPNTKVSKSVKEINAKNKLCMTGTPIENSLSELWSLFDFMMNGYLFKHDYFSKNYEKPIILLDNKKISNRLKNMVEPFILRRIKKDVLTELPDKIEEVYTVEMSEKERELYNANLAKLNNELKYTDVQRNKIQVLGMLLRLRQLCIDPRLIYDNIYTPSSKINACVELIERSIENNNKVILFSSFTTVLDLIAKECNSKNIPYYKLTGSTSKKNREKFVDRFQEKDDVKLFLISLKAGGTGLNLTEASVVIHVDPWWNVSAQNQATDRAYRIGQKNTVQVFNLITKNSIEEKIQILQEQKKELNDIFVENSEGSFAKMTKEELMDLFNQD